MKYYEQVKFINAGRFEKGLKSIRNIEKHVHRLDILRHNKVY